MAVSTRITDRGVIQQQAGVTDAGLAAPGTFSIEVPQVGSSNTVVWAPFASPLPAGAVRTWAEAVSAVNKMGPVLTTIQIEADPWHDEVVIPAGKWTLNNTILVGKVAYAQGGRNWIASSDYGNQGLNQGWQYYNEQYRGHQVKLWVHPETNGVNPPKIYGCVGLKDMFFRGTSADNQISGNDATYYGYVQDPYNPYVDEFSPGSGTCYISVTGEGDTFSDADLFTDIYNDTEGWYMTVIEVISPTLVKADTQGYPDWLVDAEGGTVSGQDWYTYFGYSGNDRNNATFDLIGRMGGKESYFSSYNSDLGTSTLYTRGNSHGGPSSSDNYFNGALLGKKIYVSNIGEYSGEYTVVKVWSNDEVEIDLPHDLTGNEGSEADYGNGNIVVNWTTLSSYHTDTFVLDNVDLRSPYDDFGTINVRCGNMTVLLTGRETSVRNGDSITTDGFLVLQSDGSPAWLGGYSIGSYNGDGYAKIYSLPGMNLNTSWFNGSSDVDYDLYQGSIVYLPDNTGDWNGTPYNVRDALDQLASRVYNLENP